MWLKKAKEGVQREGQLTLCRGLVRLPEGNDQMNTFLFIEVLDQSEYVPMKELDGYAMH